MTWQTWMFAFFWFCALAQSVSVLRLNHRILRLNDELLKKLEHQNGGDS